VGDGGGLSEVPAMADGVSAASMGGYSIFFDDSGSVIAERVLLAAKARGQLSRKRAHYGIMGWQGNHLVQDAAS